MTSLLSKFSYRVLPGMDFFSVKYPNQIVQGLLLDALLDQDEL